MAANTQGPIGLGFAEKTYLMTVMFASYNMHKLFSNKDSMLEAVSAAKIANCGSGA